MMAIFFNTFLAEPQFCRWTRSFSELAITEKGGIIIICPSVNEREREREGYIKFKKNFQSAFLL